VRSRSISHRRAWRLPRQAGAAGRRVMTSPNRHLECPASVVGIAEPTIPSGLPARIPTAAAIHLATSWVSRAEETIRNLGFVEHGALTEADETSGSGPTTIPTCRRGVRVAATARVALGAGYHSSSCSSKAAPPNVLLTQANSLIAYRPPHQWLVQCARQTRSLSCCFRAKRCFSTK